MSSTLREQLLKAGLVTEKQVKAVEQPPQKPKPQARKQPPPVSEQRLAAEQAQAAKAARDAQLNKQRQQAADAKARALEIKALVEQNKLPKKLESEDRFNFVAGKKLRFILVDPAIREGLNKGALFIIRYDGKSEVVPAEIAAKIRERDERAVVKLGSGETPVDENDPYKDFVVPDDLKW
ncbi:MAG: DUF2058 domain-containing protein [Gammaproteobacteria bacterium]